MQRREKRERREMFQSTPPYEGATSSSTTESLTRSVSIHAPVRGGDYRRRRCQPCSICFNPRPRTRGRLIEHIFPTPPPGFNPRPRTRGRQLLGSTGRKKMKVSIHAPVRGGDVLMYQFPIHRNSDVSIHAPVRGGDEPPRQSWLDAFKFQSTPPYEGATDMPDRNVRIYEFQSTPPYEGATKLPIWVI